MSTFEIESLTDKVVVVTGASRGIGADTAVRLAGAGAKVACSARTLRDGDNPLLEGSLERTVATIRESGGQAEAIVANLAEGESCRGLVSQVEEAYGPIDVLVNNAAVGFFGPTVDLKPSRWNISWQVTVSAVVLLSQLVLPRMIERGTGRIVNVSSESAVGPGRGPYGPAQEALGDTAYGAQKAAVERFTQGLAQEVEGGGVGVAAIAPSLIVPTPGALFNRLISGAEDPRAEDPGYMPEAVRLLAQLPLSEMSGRVVYSQQLLREHGVIEDGAGLGVDDRPISGYAAAR